MKPPLESTDIKEWDNWFKKEERAKTESRKADTRLLTPEHSKAFYSTRTVKINGVWKAMPLYAFGGDVIVEAEQEAYVDRNKRRLDQVKPQTREERKANRKAKRKANRNK